MPNPSPATTKCIHCHEPIFDNGTVWVHLRPTGSVDKPMVMVQTQWCDNSKKTMAESELFGRPSAAPSESRQRFEKWAGSLPKCHSDCDGDLPGESHDDDCPAKNGGDLLSMEYYEIWHAAERDTREQCADQVRTLGNHSHPGQFKIPGDSSCETCELAEHVIRGKGAQ